MLPGGAPSLGLVLANAGIHEAAPGATPRDDRLIIGRRFP
jgi:hypothetical protein